MRSEECRGSWLDALRDIERLGGGPKRPGKRVIMSYNDRNGNGNGYGKYLNKVNWDGVRIIDKDTMCTGSWRSLECLDYCRW